MGCGIDGLGCSALPKLGPLVAQLGGITALPDTEDSDLPLEISYGNDLYVGVSGQGAVAADNRSNLNIKYLGDNTELTIDCDFVIRYRHDFQGITFAGSQLPIVIDGGAKDHYVDAFFDIRKASFSYFLNNNLTFNLGYFPIQESITEFPLYIATVTGQQLDNPFIPARNKVLPGVSANLSLWESRFSFKAYYSPFRPTNSLYFDSTSLNRVMGIPVQAELVDFDVPGSFEAEHNLVLSAALDIPDFVGLRLSALYNYSAWPSPAVKSFLPTGDETLPYQMSLEYLPRQQAALSATGAFSWLSFWAQAAMSFTGSSDTTTVNSLGQLQTKNGQEHQLEVVAGLKFHQPDSPLYLSGQYSRLALLQNGDKPQHIASLKAALSLFNDDLQFLVEGDFFVKHERPVVSVGAKYRASDSVLLEAGFRYSDLTIPLSGDKNQGYIRFQYIGGE